MIAPFVSALTIFGWILYLCRWAKEQLGIHLNEVYPNGMQASEDKWERKSYVSYETAERAYNDYQAQVVENVPADKLVHFCAAQGWETLCDHFLPSNISCPTSDFPHENTKEQGFLARRRLRLQVGTGLYRFHPWLEQRKWLANFLIHILERKTMARRFIGRMWSNLVRTKE